MMKKQSIRLLREFETNNKIEGNKIISTNLVNYMLLLSRRMNLAEL